MNQITLRLGDLHEKTCEDVFLEEVNQVVPGHSAPAYREVPRQEVQSGRRTPGNFPQIHELSLRCSGGVFGLSLGLIR